MINNTCLICKEFCDKSVKFCHYLPLGDTKSVRYIRKLVSEFVIRVTICKEFLRILPGTHKNFVLSEI